MSRGLGDVYKRQPRVAPAVAAAVARVAMETGIARIKVDPEEVRANTMKRVGR